MKTSNKIIFGALIIFFSFTIFFNLGIKSAYGYWYIAGASPSDRSSTFCNEHYASCAACAARTNGLGFGWTMTCPTGERGWTCTETNDPCDLTPPLCPVPTNGNSCGSDNCSGLTYNYNGVCGGGTCNYSTQDCSDTNVCTDNSCSAATGCSIRNNTANCDDGIACTNDICSGGSCVGTANCPSNCNDLTYNYNGVCNHTTGNCDYSTQDCSDTKACTDDLCNAATGCSNPNDDTNFCTDNKDCTSPDKCDAGTCKTSVNCNTPPNNKCFQLPGACDETTWSCKYAAQSDHTACDSGNNCSPGECFGGNCVSGPNVCGGLVPCGRSADDPKTTDIDESKPCQVCHLFVLFDRIIDFLLVYILFPLAVLMLVVAGALYVGAVFEVIPGGFQILNQAKGIIFSVVIAAIVIFAAYIVIGLFLKLIGLADWTTSIYKDWWGQGLFKINCQIR